MTTLSSSEAIAEFGRRMSPFLSSPPAAGRAVVDAFVAFCRDVRIEGAEDGIMLEWGASRPHRLDAFTDLRTIEVTWDETNFEWIGLTRRILCGDGDDDGSLSAFLHFAEATGNEPSSCIEFDGVDGLDAEVNRFLAKKYVTRLLAATPSRVTAFVCEAG